MKEERLALPSGVELDVVRRDPAPAHAATPWLLVHGLASNARMWDGVARRLCDLGHPTAAVDQRGHGRSSKPDDGYDVATVADDLALLLDALGWTRAAVAGQSWGGNVVLELAHRHPERVAVAACIDGGFIDLQARFPQWVDCERVLAPPRLQGMPAAELEAAIRAAHADWPEEGIRGALANFEIRPDGTIAPWLTFERHLKVLRGLWEHRPAQRYPHLRVPLLLVPADTGDAAWTHAKEEAVDAALAALPRGRVQWFRPAHHDVHAQHPGAVAELLHRAVTDPAFFPGQPGATTPGQRAR